MVILILITCTERVLQFGRNLTSISLDFHGCLVKMEGEVHEEFISSSEGHLMEQLDTCRQKKETSSNAEALDIAKKKKHVRARSDSTLGNSVIHSDDEVSILGSESSDDDYSFEESDEEDDDDIFEDYIDNNVAADMVPLVFPELNEAEEDDLEDDEKTVDDSDELKSISGSDDEARVRYPEFNPLVDYTKKICLQVGMRFGSAEIFKNALKQYSIENGGDFYYLHNDHKKVSAYCKLKCDCPMVYGRKKCVCGTTLCGFKACARRMGSDGTIQLKSFVPNHECGWQHENTKVTSVWLAHQYIEQHRDDPGWKLTAFMSAVRRDHAIDISYTQAWRARLRAMLITQGDARVQYGRVWDYAATLSKYNPGSSTYVKVCQDNPERPLFQRLYVCLEACKKGFMMGCRPIVGLDGCHLKGAYTGQVLVAVGKDGNENIFPIAYAVVEAERKETWAWFLEILMQDIGSANPTFMSDRQKGLIEALSDVVPMADTRVCVRHLYNNFKVKWPGKTYKDALWAAAKACNKSDFDFAMEEIKSLDERAYDYLIRAKPETWSRHAFKHYTKCDMLLNNVCESFNSYILRARDKPILTMCEWIRRRLMKRFVSKREGMSKYNGTLTPRTFKKIESAKEEGMKMCRALWGGHNRYEVDHKGRAFVVDLGTRSCGCNKWGLTGIPCPHAVCCILSARLRVEDYVLPYYTKETYLKTYNKEIEPMPGPVDWEKTRLIAPEPPKYVVQLGRPKKARRREKGEEKASKQRRVRIDRPRCSRCGQEGHYKSKCVNAPKTQEPPKPRNVGGRPRNPNTVQIGTQRRKYTKKAFQAGGESISASSVQTPSGAGSQAATQASTTTNV